MSGPVILTSFGAHVVTLPEVKLVFRRNLVLHPSGFTFPVVDEAAREAAAAAKKEARRLHDEARGPGKRRKPKLTHVVFVEKVHMPWGAPTVDRQYRFWCRDNCQHGWAWGGGSEHRKDHWTFRFKSEADAMLFQIFSGGVAV